MKFSLKILKKIFFSSYLSYSKNFFLTKFFDLEPCSLIPPFFGTPCIYMYLYIFNIYICTYVTIQACRHSVVYTRTSRQFYDIHGPDKYTIPILYLIASTAQLYSSRTTFLSYYRLLLKIKAVFNLFKTSRIILILL